MLCLLRMGFGWMLVLCGPLLLVACSGCLGLYLVVLFSMVRSIG